MVKCHYLKHISIDRQNGVDPWSPMPRKDATQRRRKRRNKIRYKKKKTKENEKKEKRKWKKEKSERKKKRRQNKRMIKRDRGNINQWKIRTEEKYLEKENK